ncbi:MAG: thiamine phosphate synthase [Planctomycetota bacterium]
MTAQRDWKGFYFITDENYSVDGFLKDVQAALASRAAMVQYRRKNRVIELTSRYLIEAVAIRDLCRAHGVPFIVNDDIEFALDVGADGLHVGPDDLSPGEARKLLGPDLILGVSVATPEEARAAVESGADYVAASPIFSTPTKFDTGTPVGFDGLSSIREAVGVPLAAIGGLNSSNARNVGRCGAELLCAISASYADNKLSRNIERLSRLHQEGLLEYRAVK